MQVSNGSVVANITGSVNTAVPTIPAGAVQVIVDTGLVAASPTDIYTVPAGKTLYIVAAHMGIESHNAAIEGGIASIQVDDLGTGTYHRILSIGCGHQASGSGAGGVSITFTVPITVPATKKVQEISNDAGNMQVCAGFTGYYL
jgi:hypothetical protein